jgi:L-lactate dehydrogenase complex protein LldG
MGLCDGREVAAIHHSPIAAIFYAGKLERLGQESRVAADAAPQFQISNRNGAEMSSRDTILRALRTVSHADEPRPAYPKCIAFEDPVAKFAEVLEATGGVYIRVATAQEADARLRELEAYRSARQIASFIPGIGESTLDCSKIERPHELKSLDLAILPGEFGVAENAAVWVSGNTLGRHRVVFVIAQHLVLVVRADEIVSHMLEAYARVKLDGYGLFISGPSKTADIEQALVIGAHGARSCTVFVIG